MGRWIAILLVGLEAIVVLQAEVGVRFSQIRAAESPTISRTPLLAENVFVEKQPPVLQPILTSSSNQIDLLLRNWSASAAELIAPNFVSVFLAGKEPESVFDVWGRETERWTKSVVYRQYIRASGSHEEVNSGSGPVILGLGFQDLVSFAKIFNSMLINPDISAQLQLFLLSHDPQLTLAGCDLITAIFGLKNANYQQPKREQDIERNANAEGNFEPKFYALAAFLFFVGFVVFFGKGLKRFVEGPGFLSGATMMLIGGLLGVAAVWVFIASIIGHSVWLFSENVSAAPGIDASAPRYGCTENIHVVAVVVPELKLRDIQRQILGADFVECADAAEIDRYDREVSRQSE